MNAQIIQVRINALNAIRAAQYEQLQIAKAEWDKAAATDPFKDLREKVNTLRDAWYETHTKVAALETVLADMDGFGGVEVGK